MVTDTTVQERVEQLAAVRTRARRWPLWALVALLAAAVWACAAWDSHARATPPWALIALSSLLVAGALAAGLVFLRWRDALTQRFVELGTRRVAEFDEASDATFILNLDGQIEAINRATEQMLGWTRETVRRRSILEILDLAPPGETPFVGRLEATNGPLALAISRELVARRFDGGETPVDVTIRSMHMQDGQYIAIYVRDISDRKRIERLKDEFVSTVSHELRTPLTSIAGSLGLLIGGATDPLPEGPARLIAIAHANCQRLVRLINDILDVEKIESGKMKFEFAPLSLAQAAERSIDTVRGLADQMGVTLKLDAETPDIQIRGDIDRLVQVGANLISNAVKFSKTGDVVEVSARRWGAWGASPCRTTDRAYRRSSAPASSPSSPRPTRRTPVSAAAPALASSSPRRSPSDTVGGCGSIPPSARARPSTSTCRSPKRPRARRPTARSDCWSARTISTPPRS